MTGSTSSGITASVYEVQVYGRFPNESYGYDADNGRVTRTVGSSTRIYLEGALWEEAGTTTKTAYLFGGQVVALRNGSLIGYLHGDHLGSVSVATDEVGAPSTRTITVNYPTGGGTAVAASDYTATSGTVTFAPGETSKSVSIVLLNDATSEPNETVNVTLSAPTNATLGTPTVGTLTIIDDDQTGSALNQYYNYDAIGNFTTKANKAYGYSASVTCAAGTRTLKHAPQTAGSAWCMTHICSNYHNSTQLASQGRRKPGKWRS